MQNFSSALIALMSSYQAEARQHGDAPPETAEQLEALVAEEPDSSMLWIRYVAYLLSTGDVAAARGIAERALQTINYRQAPSEAVCRPLARAGHGSSTAHAYETASVLVYSTGLHSHNMSVRHM